jgi:hypothetical protein
MTKADCLAYISGAFFGVCVDARAKLGVSGQIQTHLVWRFSKI